MTEDWKKLIFGELLAISDYPLIGFTIKQATEFASKYDSIMGKIPKYFCDLLLANVFPRQYIEDKQDWNLNEFKNPENLDEFIKNPLPLHRKSDFLIPILLHEDDNNKFIFSKLRWCFSADPNVIDSFPLILSKENNKPVARIYLRNYDLKRWIKNFPEFEISKEESMDGIKYTLRIKQEDSSYSASYGLDELNFSYNDKEVEGIIDIFTKMKISFIIDQIIPGLNKVRNSLKKYGISLETPRQLIERYSQLESFNFDEFIENMWNPYKKLIIDWLFDEYPNLLLSIFDENLKFLDSELIKLESSFLERDYGKIVIEVGNITQDLLSYLYFYLNKQKYDGDGSIKAFMQSGMKHFINTNFSDLSESDIEYIRQKRNPRSHSIMHVVTAQEARQTLTRTKLLLESFRVWISETRSKP